MLKGIPVLSSNILLLKKVYQLVHETISISYNSTYCEAAQDHFHHHHPFELICEDAKNGYVIAIQDKNSDDLIGTGTLVGNYIGRVYVHPSFQKKGIGTTIMEHLEIIARSNKNKTIELDASLNSKDFYLHRGYEILKSEVTLCSNGNELPYFKMKLNLD